MASVRRLPATLGGVSQVAEVTFTTESVARLRERHTAALEHGEDQFTFEGNDYVTAYAGYLLQYLEGQFDAAQ